jgi:hypothetical protein
VNDRVAYYATIRGEVDMRDRLAMRKAAEAIADQAIGRNTAADSSALCLSEALAAFHEHCREAKDRYNGRELTLFEAQPEKVGRLFDLIVAGNYRETAARIVGITDRAIRMWMQKADAGDERYQAVANVVHVAEALAESSAVRDVRAAGKSPQFWAASMTYLERRYPGKWGRRPDDTEVPRVIVQIGIKDSDVSLSVAQGSTRDPVRQLTSS